MDLEIKIDENLKEPKITISSPTLTDEIQKITEILKNTIAFSNFLKAYRYQHL